MFQNGVWLHTGDIRVMIDKTRSAQRENRRAAASPKWIGLVVAVRTSLSKGKRVGAST